MWYFRFMEQQQDRLEATGITSVMNEPADFVAVSSRGQSLVTIGFYEVLINTDYEFVDMRLWEIRSYRVDEDYPESMSEEELEERLDRWVQYDYENLPTLHYGHFSEREIRDAPFLKMWQASMSHYLESERSEEFVLPTELEFTLAASRPESFGFRSVRDMNSTFDQLRAVDAYVTATKKGNDKPIHAVSLQLFGNLETTSVNRARNLIQFARTGKQVLMTKANHGRAGGLPTRGAVYLANDIRAAANISLEETP